MSTAVLSVGSNLGDRQAQLRSIVDSLAPWIRAVSGVYESAPWGPVPQPDFLNAVLVVNDPERESHDWLKLARELETEAGRERSERWGPRVMDVDVIQVRDERGAEVFSDDPELVLPHPRASIRAFVLLPWLEVEASARLAGQSVAELLTSLPPGELSEVRLRDDLLLGER